MTPSEEAEAARKAYSDSTANLALHYGQAGRIVLDPDAWEFLLAVSKAYWQARDKGLDESEHPWFPKGTKLRMGWLMHELGRTHDYIQHQQRITEDLRRKWLIAKAKAGQFVSPHSLASAGTDSDDLG